MMNTITLSSGAKIVNLAGIFVRHNNGQAPYKNHYYAEYLCGSTVGRHLNTDSFIDAVDQDKNQIYHNCARVLRQKLPSGAWHVAFVSALVMPYPSAGDVPVAALHAWLDKCTAAPILPDWTLKVASCLKGLIHFPEKKRTGVMDTEVFGGVSCFHRFVEVIPGVEDVISELLEKRKLPVNSDEMPEYKIELPRYGAYLGQKNLKKAFGELETSGLWASGRMKEFLAGKDPVPTPLMPLRTGHVGLVIAAGNLNNKIIRDGKRRIVIKAGVRKSDYLVKSSDTEEIRREKMTVTIKYADLNSGKILEVSGDEI